MYGGTYAQIGEWSRGFHATQGMGSLKDEQNWPLPLHQLKTASGKTFLDDLTEEVPKNLSCLANYCEKSDGKQAAQMLKALQKQQCMPFRIQAKCSNIFVNFRSLC